MGTSIPASGGEHLLSHTLDMMAEVRGESHDLHGRQVGIGTVLSAALFERVLAIESPVLRDLPPEVDEAVLDRAVGRLGGAGAVRGQEAATGALREKIAQPGRLGSAQDTGGGRGEEPGDDPRLAARAGGATCAADIGCSRERLRSAILHMHEIRKRFTIIDLAWLTGVMPAAVDDIIDEWLESRLTRVRVRVAAVERLQGGELVVGESEQPVQAHAGEDAAQSWRERSTG